MTNVPALSASARRCTHGRAGNTNEREGVTMTVTVKLMMLILLWNNDGSFHTSAAEVTKCPEVAIFRAVMEDNRTAGKFKSWAAFCQQVSFGSDSPI